jgi:Flp pilus assembly protein TadB
MEAIKYVLFYGMEAIVVGVVAVTVFAGLYQLVREKIQARRVTREATETVVERS